MTPGGAEIDAETDSNEGLCKREAEGESGTPDLFWDSGLWMREFEGEAGS